MKLFELFKAETTTPKHKTLIIFSGGFHPPHLGHFHVYKSLVEKYPNADVFVASTDNTTSRPFSFKQKKFLAVQAGIPANRFVQVKNPYRCEEITKNYDADNTTLMFAVSSKDAKRLASGKKESYLQPLAMHLRGAGLKPMTEQGYFLVIPHIEFSINGKQITSASTIREMYKTGTPSARDRIIHDLYPNATDVSEIKRTMDAALGCELVTESLEYLSQLRTTGHRAALLLPTGKVIVSDWHDELLDKIHMTYAQFFEAGGVRIRLTGSGDVCIEFEKNDPGTLDRAVSVVTHLPIRSGSYYAVDYRSHLSGGITFQGQAADVIKKIESLSSVRVRRPEHLQHASGFDPSFLVREFIEDTKFQSIAALGKMRSNCAIVIPPGEMRSSCAIDIPPSGILTGGSHYDLLNSIGEGYDSFFQQGGIRIVRFGDGSFGLQFSKNDAATLNLVTQIISSHPSVNDNYEIDYSPSYLPGGDREANEAFSGRSNQVIDMISALAKTNRQIPKERHAQGFDPRFLVHESGGVGVVKNSKDPRYVMSTTCDVKGDTLNKEMKAFGLIGRKAPKTQQKKVGKNIGQGVYEDFVKDSTDDFAHNFKPTKENIAALMARIIKDSGGKYTKYQAATFISGGLAGASGLLTQVSAMDCIRAYDSLNESKVYKTPFKICWHGGNAKYLRDIMKNGLRPLGYTNIYMTQSEGIAQWGAEGKAPWVPQNKPPFDGMVLAINIPRDEIKFTRKHPEDVSGPGYYACREGEFRIVTSSNPVPASMIDFSRSYIFPRGTTTGRVSVTDWLTKQSEHGGNN